MSRTRLRVESLEDRLAPAAGSLDPTFGTGGAQTLTSGYVSELAVVPDGRVLAIVYEGPPSLRRLLANGSPDPTFGTGGKTLTPDPNVVPNVLTALPDGGALVGWSTFDGVHTTMVFEIARYTAAGNLDPTFGTGGIVVIPTPGGNDRANVATIVVQPDGRILVSGDQTPDQVNLGQFRYFQDLVVRLTATGQLDSTFGTGGIAVVSDPTGTIKSLRGGNLSLQSDGRLVLGGDGSTSLVGMSQTYGPLALRLTATGQLDPTFGTGGFTSVSFPQQTAFGFSTTSVLPDGRVLLAGAVRVASGNTVGVAARLTADGQLDTSYGSGGKASITPELSSVLTNVVIDSFGRAVLSAASATNNSVFRLTAGGVADTGFGTNGQVIVSNLPGLNQISPSDLSLSRSLVVQPNGNILLGGTDHESTFLTGNYPDSGLVVELVGSNPPGGFVPTGAGAVTVGGATDGSFQVLNPANGTYALAGTTTAYAGFQGNVRSATADVNGDGTQDYILAVGPGGPPGVTIFDGKTGSLIADFLAFEPSFTGGLFVAAADLDGDGRAEVLVAPDQGGGPRVVVFTVSPGGSASQRASFLGIDDANFRGGLRIALGDINKDGSPDLVVAAGFLGGPRVAIFNGKTVGGTPTRLMSDFFAFPGTDAVSLRNGAFVAVGDVNGDGSADLVFGGGPGGALRVFILSGALVAGGDVAGAQANPLSNFFVGGNTADRGGVTVAAVSGATRAGVAVGSGQGNAAKVRVYQGIDFTSTGEPTTFQDIAVFGGATLPGGVFVG